MRNKKVVRLTESKLKQMIAEAIQEVIEDDNRKAYHCVMPKNMQMEDAIRSVVQNGLIPHNNGERGTGIWFSVGSKFYGDEPPFIVSLKLNQENIEKFNIVDSQRGSAVAFARKPIAFEELEVEKIPIVCFNGRFSCYNPNDPNNFYEKMFVNRGRDFVDMLNGNPYPNIVVYKDIIEKFCSQEFCNRIRWNDITNPNVKVVNLL